MYEARQNKEKVSRVIERSERDSQQLKVKSTIGRRFFPIQYFGTFHTQKKPPIIDLITEEDNGGHTIARHVCTREQVILRIQNEGQVPSSYWPNLGTAQNAVQQIVNRNWNAIKTWANTPGVGQMGLTYANNNGFVSYEDLIPHQSDNAQMYISKNQIRANTPTNVLVVTCYPTLNAIPQIDKAVKRIFHLDDNWQNKRRKQEQGKYIAQGEKKKETRKKH